MQYLGLTAFNELGNGFVNDRHVVIVVMGNRYDRLWHAVQMCIRDRRLWVYRYERLWHAVPWSDSFQ